MHFVNAKGILTGSGGKMDILIFIYYGLFYFVIIVRLFSKLASFSLSFIFLNSNSLIKSTKEHIMNIPSPLKIIPMLIINGFIRVRNANLPLMK